MRELERGAQAEEQLLHSPAQAHRELDDDMDGGGSGVLSKTLELLREYVYFNGFVAEALLFLSIFQPQYNPSTP